MDTTFFSFQYSKFITIDDQGNEIVAPMWACELVVGFVTKVLIVNTNCHFYNSSGKNFVVSAVLLNKASVSISQGCFEEYRTNVEYQDHLNNNAWTAVPPNRVTAFPAPSQ